MILVDAGAMVAWVDASDQHYGPCAAALREVREPMGTVWPAVTEALDRLVDVPPGQDAVLEMLRRGVVRLLPLGEDDLPRIQELMAKYRDRGMGLADAALVRVAERDALDRVFTVDRRDFEAYRIGRRKPFRILPEVRKAAGGTQGRVVGARPRVVGAKPRNSSTSSRGGSRRSEGGDVAVRPKRTIRRVKR